MTAASTAYEALRPSNVSGFSEPYFTGSAPPGADTFSYSQATPEAREDLVNSSLLGVSGGATNGTLQASTDTTDFTNITDTAAGYAVEVVEIPEIIYTKQTDQGVVLELTPPYLSDDRLVKYTQNRFRVYPSDAPEKAKAFARAQSRLNFGYKNGQSVVFPVEYVANEPFSPVYLTFDGVTAQYRLDRQSIVFDSTGILVSGQAIFWGGVGQ